ncbi:MAG: hypothetical protein MJY95_08280 [Bacteroidaceae bacterium]|nr:hypothetical protein [Bacteroidaceae bacterium]
MNKETHLKNALELMRDAYASALASEEEFKKIGVDIVNPISTMWHGTHAGEIELHVYTGIREIANIIGKKLEDYYGFDGRYRGDKVVLSHDGMFMFELLHLNEETCEFEYKEDKK